MLQKCSRSLPCGHFCKKKCHESCGDCKEKVTKTITDCKHEIKILCMEIATRKLCTHKCERTLSCLHPCPGMCKDECDATACNRKIQSYFNSPCGHKVRLPCNVFQMRETGTITEDDFLRYCEEPCMELLACGHICQGTCSQCLQGRLHAPCKQICHQMNICGHQCQEPCNQLCPPCNLRCEVQCSHSRCGKLCGAQCTPCQEPCNRSCAHGACSRRCGEACSRAACEAACPLALPCGHACRGLCGEPCPDICKLCRPEQFPKDFLGDDFEDDAKFIQLQDCPHVMELENMDAFMLADKETIAIRTCPFCRKPIVNTNRYKDLVNKMILTEINPVKDRVYGTKNNIKMRMDELFKKLKGFVEKHHLIYKDNLVWRKAFISIKESHLKQKNMSLLTLDMQVVYLDTLEIISKIYNKYRLADSKELESELKEHINIICKYLNANIQKISQQQQKDIGNEIKRLNDLVQLVKIMSHSAYKSTKTTPKVEQALVAAKQTILGWRVHNEDTALQSLRELQEAVKLNGLLSKAELNLVVRAIGLKAGHWFKCPNGHFYCIGECGGAQQISKCVECGESVGGQNHRLLGTNAHAPEIDGSSFAAWSDQYNNMANFNFD